MNKRLMLTALLLSSLSISGYAYGAERMIVNQGDSASIISQTISGVIANNTDHGAVVFSKGNLTVSDSKFDSNEGRSNYLMGGAIFTGGTATVTNSEFTNNKSSYGAAIYNQANLTVENSKFINNSIHHFNDAFDAGAAIDNNDACNVVLNVNNSYFEGNSNGSRNGGGAIYFGSVSDIQSKISNSIFLKNDSSYRNANESSGKGGAIGMYNGNLLLENNTFTQNTANDGGALYLRDGADANLEIVGGSFNNNSADKNGGAIYSQGNMSIKNAIFDGNKVNSSTASSGGAIFVDAIDDIITIENATFKNNIAINTSSHGADGSAISVKNGTVNIIGSTFENNVADQGTINQYASRGGERVSVINIDKSIFKNNEALNIGGVGIFNKGKITNSIFEGNKATVAVGGAMFVGSEGAVAVLDNVTFKNNTSASSGGAIGTRVGQNSETSFNNNSQAVLNITNSTFEGNTATTTGGAIDNHFYNNQNGITNSIFKNNSAKDGGAIFNHGDKDNQGKFANLNITGGSFVDNIASGNGGAIYNQADATIKGVQFTGNKAENGFGGAVYVNTRMTSSLVNDATTNISESVFEGNSAYIGGALFNHNGKTEISSTAFNNNTADFGGAIYSTTSEYAELTIKDSSFTGNTALSAGAVDALGQTTLENVVFTNNHATDANDDGGGALFLGAVADAILENVTFDGNTSQAVGGAIATRSSSEGDNTNLYAMISNSNFVNNSSKKEGGAIYSATNNMVISDTSFINNSSESKGGAIYSEGDLMIAAQTKDVIFDGNTSANLEDGCDIFMAVKDSKLAFNIADGKTITLNGGISGTEEGYDITVNEMSLFAGGSSGSGILNINSYVKNANMNITDATLKLGADADISDVSSVTITNGGLDTANGVSDSFATGQVSLVGDVDLMADVSLSGNSAKGDNLRSVIENSTSANVTITGINGVGDTTANNVTIDVKKALGLDGLSNVSVDTTGNFVAQDSLTPIRWLKGSMDETTGMVTYAPRGNSFKDFNPAIMAGPVAAQLGGFMSQVNSYNQAFMNMDMKMLLTREEREAMRMKNSYASSSSPQVFSPTYLSEEQKAGWVRPYASFEKVGLDGGPRVNNVMYGSFFGADSDMYELNNGAQAQFSVYAGYTGSHQSYSGNSVYQNGGTLGLTGIVYKDNFFTALTANTGASVADMSTMYGSEDMPMMMAGVASKTGYNWELAKGKFIVQPSYLMSYTFVNAFDYTNAAGVKIKSDAMNAIQIAPGVKFIGNLKNGWQPYINLRMVWNLMDKAEFTAANTSLPELSVKPYFEYGLGVQKRWGERFTGFGQAMLRAGGRTGVGMGFGFRWALGKAPQKSYEPSYSQNIIQPTSVKLGNIK